MTNPTEADRKKASEIVRVWNYNPLIVADRIALALAEAREEERERFAKGCAEHD